ncbi:MAG: hypothetical protein IT323_08220 [Anaerolineae bacterium]|nr:hypothetical protein [Anaerolineae bacterium]
MKRRTVVAGALILIVAFVLGAVAIQATGALPSSYTFRLAAGEERQGDLVVTARDVSFAAGSRVAGDVSIMAVGSIDLAGTIDGDLSILAPASDVQLADSFALTGNLTVCARRVTPLDGLSIGGRRETGCDRLATLFSGSGESIQTAIPALHLPLFSGYSGSGGAQIVQMALTAFLVAGVAAAIAFFFPDHLRQISATAFSQTRLSLLAGLMLLGLAVGISLLVLVLTLATVGGLCVGLPLFAGAWAILLAALIVGWVAIAYPLGGWLLRRSAVNAPPVAAAALGALALTGAHGLIQIVPCLGWLSFLVLLGLGSVGLGALILTRAGTRPYPQFVRRRA